MYVALTPMRCMHIVWQKVSTRQLVQINLVWAMLSTDWTLDGIREKSVILNFVLAWDRTRNNRKNCDESDETSCAIAGSTSAAIWPKCYSMINEMNHSLVLRQLRWFEAIPKSCFVYFFCIPTLTEKMSVNVKTVRSAIMRYGDVFYAYSFQFARIVEIALPIWE